MLLEILAQPGDDSFFRRTFHHAVLQREQCRSLHGIQNLKPETAFGIHEFSPDIIDSLLPDILEICGIPSCSSGHIPHHTGIQSPI